MSARDFERCAQTTIEREVEASGIGLFTGEKVSMTICPEKENTGIVFEREDLPGKPQIKALLENVEKAPRCTRLAKGGISVHMVEHLMAALSGMGIDNARVKVRGPEILAGDGSALPFVELLRSARKKKQKSLRKILRIEKPIYWSKAGVHLIALPSEEFRVSYTMHYPKSALLRSQYYSTVVTEEIFEKQIAPCRTFSFYEEILPLMEKGLIKGGGLENALVIQKDRVMNPEGVRFFDEMARHKALDLIGDLSLTGFFILGHIVSICSGHASNIAFAKMIQKLGSQ